MNVLSVSELKHQLHKVIQQVNNGDDVIISLGLHHEKVAVIVPYNRYQQFRERRLDLLASKGPLIINDNFALTEEEFLSP